MISVFDNKVECCGCSACKNICPTNAIKMSLDDEGFMYPEINQELCSNCGLCRKVCPMQNSDESEINIEVYGCKNKDVDEKLNSSSGGMFSIISRYILDNEGVVFGAAFDSKFRVEHLGIDAIHDLDRLRRSKYVQSDIGNTYKEVKEVLALGRKVLFSGTPCQIAGLKNYIKGKNENLYLIDVICHGVPSPQIFEKYLEYLSKNYGSKIKSINFCAKELSIKALKINFINGKVYLKNATEDYYYKAFSNNVMLRPSCYNCKHNNFRSCSDISLADYWGASERFENYQEKTEGVSLAIIKTTKGKELFELINDKMEFVETTLEHAIKGNPNITSPSMVNKNREAFFKDYENKVEIAKLLKKYTKVNPIKKILPKLKYELSKIRNN